MKRTFTANIDGQIFHIDEDAYNLLQEYLQELHTTFSGTEGAEIASDIESRIREHFNDKLNTGANVIVLADVSKVITTMGRPEDISAESEGTTDNRRSESDSTRPFISINLPRRKRLYRNLKDKVFGGVIGGLAVYLGWNASIMRILYAALAVCTYFWPLIILYMIAWMIIQPAATPRQILEMQGRPITLDSVGETVIEGATPPPYNGEEQGFWSILWNGLGKIVAGFFGLISCSVGIACLIFLIIFATGFIMYHCFDNATILNYYDYNFSSHMLAPVCVMLWFLFVICLSTIVTWASSTVIFRVRDASRSTKIIFAIITMVIFIAAVAVSSIVGISI